MNFTNKDILRVAMTQSAVDTGCAPEDFLRSDNVVVLSRPHPDARKYLKLPHSCDLASYGSNVVAAVSPETKDIVADYIGRFSVAHCFETPNLHVLEDALRPLGLRICFMAEYFLPDVNALTPLACPYEMKILGREDFADLYTEQWSNALCAHRAELDVLGVGACDGDRLVGLAACSADCDTMWQIGIDVLPEYRRRGIAAALTSQLALEILERGKVPFYCAAWSNIPSVRNAIRSGFRPAWVQMTAKSAEFVDGMNNGQ
ncbi:MAG: GNAT family N-acetyltransferase [Ruminococcaceae bacterium]|nr:GNAT family N-acetyltransferase [Oscillospiraceae bacterium]